MDLEIIVPVARRAAIDNLLYSLSRNTVRPDRVTLVSNELRASELRTHGLNLRLLRFHSAVYPIGLMDVALRRNVGIWASRATHVLMFDDDQIAPAGLIEASFSLLGHERYFWGNYRYIDFSHWSLDELLELPPSAGVARESPNIWHSFRSAYGGLFGADRLLLENIGAFDMQFNCRHGGEDQDLGRRLALWSNQGESVFIYEPPFAWHPQERVPWDSDRCSNLCDTEHQTIKEAPAGSLRCIHCPFFVVPDELLFQRDVGMRFDRSKVQTLIEEIHHGIRRFRGSSVSDRLRLASDEQFRQQPVNDGNGIADMISSNAAFWDEGTTVNPVAYAIVANLRLPEFAAWDPRNELPRMRRWEQPFVLFQAKLAPTMMILDCSINAAGFGERLARVFRHVSYRNVPPITNGAFMLPASVPDGAFDRVFCVNTLEHLTYHQRIALLKWLTRKLKPSGALIVTLDQYFSGSWRLPAFRDLGVMAEDCSESFGGWNFVTLQDISLPLKDLGFTPAGPVPPNGPHRSDGSLYLQTAPYEHAILGAAFTAGRASIDDGVRRRIVLGLLTSNMKNVAIDSVLAHFREADTLQRLGHDGMVCVFDNGSTDGTAAILREIDQAVQTPHHFIYSGENAGRSIGLNQIIDFALSSNADYLLFMDGDVELTPLSSFAMLRYLEDEGYVVGCVSADLSNWSSQRNDCTQLLLYLGESDTLDSVASTEYGLFRCDVFRAGVRFDEAGPLDHAEWGFGDSDLAFQMVAGGFTIRRALELRYLRRRASSPTEPGEALGIDVQDLFDQRRQRLLLKWSGSPFALDHVASMSPRR